jgi:PPK2 family polyphosphate:nucleotide phosphotransferase
MSRGARERFFVEPGVPFTLGDRDPGDTSGAPGDKKATRAAVAGFLADELAPLQERLYAESRQSLLVVLQAMDAGGKDGAVKHVFSGTNPQGVRVTSFKQPTPEELAHDFLWRVHANVPPHGYIGIFNRSHYEDVVAVRIHELVDESVWRRRYRHINHFEALLHDAGVRVVKLFLHISRDEQAERLQARLDDPTKRWKFRRGDLADRERWDDYMTAYGEAIARTSTEHAPWYVVPADKKWFRDWAVSRIVIETLADMDPQFPAPAEDLDGVTVT